MDFQFIPPETVWEAVQDLPTDAEVVTELLRTRQELKGYRVVKTLDTVADVNEDLIVTLWAERPDHQAVLMKIRMVISTEPNEPPEIFVHY